MHDLMPMSVMSLQGDVVWALLGVANGEGLLRGDEDGV